MCIVTHAALHSAGTSKTHVLSIKWQSPTTARHDQGVTMLQAQEVSPLIEACSNGAVEEVIILLAQGANVNETDLAVS